MNINSKTNLFLRDVYSYDISSCHYRILESFGFDISNIDKENKEKRNIKIGKMMGENSRISNILRTTTSNLISEYLKINKIEDSDVITRQYDGFISKKPLKILDRYLPLELRCIYNVFLISIDRNQYIALDSKGEITVKGVAYKYDEIVEFYKKILNINYINRKLIFSSLKKIKDEILNSQRIEIYSIPIDNDFFNIFFKGYGCIPISKSLFSMTDLNDIDQEKYFNIYLRPFTESICYEFL